MSGVSLNSHGIEIQTYRTQRNCMESKVPMVILISMQWIISVVMSYRQQSSSSMELLIVEQYTYNFTNKINITLLLFANVCFSNNILSHALKGLCLKKKL